jgi:hypothetical protein
LGYSRQYCYKQQKEQEQVSRQKKAVKQMVDEQRKQLPYLGTRKLHYQIGPALKQKGLKIGRDKLFAWMREYGLLIKPRRRYTQTTNSKHWLKKYPNLVKYLTVTAPEQVPTFGFRATNISENLLTESAQVGASISGLRVMFTRANS